MSNKGYREKEKIIPIWKVKWLITINNKISIHEMKFESYYEAFSMMVIHLKRKKCSWIEQQFQTILYREYENY